MKKILTLIVVALAISVNAFAAIGDAVGYYQKSSNYYLKTAERPEPQVTESNFYDADGNLAVVATSYNYKLNTYYNGNVVWSESHGSNGTLNSGSSYSYDSEGNLSKITNMDANYVATTTTEYGDYVNGYVGFMTNKNKDGQATYETKYEYTWDGVIPTSVISYYKNSEGNWTELSKTTYTYTDGKLASGQAYFFSNGEWAVAGAPIVYTWNGDKLVSAIGEVASRGNTYISETIYSYTDYSADYVVNNLSQTSVGPVKNSFVFSWEAPTAAVDGYRAFIDGALVNETNTELTFTTPVLKNGQHNLAIVSVKDGVERNISSVKFILASDTGVLPASDFKVTSVTPEKTSEYGEYPVSVSWTAPSTSSNITSYKVYYSQYSYYEVTDPTATSADILIPYWICETSGEDGTEGVKVNLFVVVEYATGTSEASNTSWADPFDDDYEGKSSVSDVNTDSMIKVYPNPAVDNIYFSEEVCAKIYGVNGDLKVAADNVTSISVAELPASIYFVTAVTKSGEKITKTICVK